MVSGRTGFCTPAFLYVDKPADKNGNMVSTLMTVLCLGTQSANQ
jgi:hypothetical protein